MANATTELAFYFALLFSGWINPVFLIFTITSLVKPLAKAIPILGLALIVMMIAPWVAFYEIEMKVHPVSGYYLWTAAMLLVVVSGIMVRKDQPKAPLGAYENSPAGTAG